MFAATRGVVMDKEEKFRQYAEKVKIFNGLHPDEIAQILQQGRKIEFREGQTIFHEGQMGSHIFIVLSGVVALYNKETLIAKCEAGDAFGEMSVLNHRPHCATAAANSTVRLFTIDEKQINSILEKHVAVRFLLNIIHVLSAHLEHTNTDLAVARKGSDAETSS